MPAAADLLLDPATLDLTFSGGDFAVGASDPQHVRLLLSSMAGDWRADGRVGVNLPRYLMGPYGPRQVDELEQQITEQLTRDGYQVADLNATDLATLTLTATRP